MDEDNEAGSMSAAEFLEALDRLGWKQSDFCRKTGVSKNTPSRWANGATPIPVWVPAYLGAMTEIRRLHDTYVKPQ